MSLLLLCGGRLTVVRAAAPPVAEVQGLYEGTGKDAAGGFKLEARVVAQGKGAYKVLVRQWLGGDRIARVELAGKTAEDTVSFAGKAGEQEWKGAYAAGTIKGDISPGGTFELRRVEKPSPTLGKRPPAGAIVLLDGKDFTEMVRAKGTNWPPANVGEDGSIQVPGSGMNSKRAFEGSFDLHVEFLIPLMPSDHSQGRGNSGVYLPNGDEIQVLDSFGDTTYLGGGCGGLYNYKDPDAMETIESLKGKPECQFTLASLPPLAWQTYDVEYRVEQKDGKYVGKPKVTMFHNGLKIHDNAVLRNNARKGGFHFQDHGNPVRYRNIWVLPLNPP